MKHISQIIITFLLTSISSQAQLKFPELNSWQKAEKTVNYTPDNLWEYINGAADYYLKYGFVKMEMIEYSQSSDYLTVEAYMQEAPINAFGIYAFERPSKTNYINMGVEGYLEPSALHFWVDQYYFKITSNKENNGKTLQILGKAIIAENKLMGFKPDFLKSFPSMNKIAHTEKFYAQNYLGHEFLHSALEASYKDDNCKPKLFIINCKNKTEARKMVQSYLNFVKSEENIREGEILQLDDMFTGIVCLTQLNNKVLGTTEADTPETAIKYLNRLISSAANKP
ncbi:DUF6599 family protein [Saccharicrinis sp. GN24d3]|uniref:DUF6599 family protein n=1 Tax=Saccharicrinis sp. GN24d3 TaxID=3458416 RepID=UPI004036C3E9